MAALFQVIIGQDITRQYHKHHSCFVSSPIQIAIQSPIAMSDSESDAPLGTHVEIPNLGPKQRAFPPVPKAEFAQILKDRVMRKQAARVRSLVPQARARASQKPT